MSDLGFESRQFAMGERKEKTVIQAEKAQATCCLQAEEEVGRGSSGAGSQRSAYGSLSFIPWALERSKAISLLYINPGTAGIWELSLGGCNINFSGKENPQNG